MPVTSSRLRSHRAIPGMVRGPATILAVVALVLTMAGAAGARAHFDYRKAHRYAAGAYPSAVAVADFNQDGIPDLVVARDLSSSVAVLLGKGNGRFKRARQWATQPNGNPEAVAVGDLNGDGVPDIVATDSDGSSLMVLIGKGNGRFRPAVKEYVGWIPRGVVVADFDHDGHADIATADEQDDEVSLLNGTGCGWTNSPDTCGSTPAFEPVESFPLPKRAEPGAIAAGNLNGDRLPDLAVADQKGNAISLLRNNGGDGAQAFDPAVTVSTGPHTHPSHVAIADLNRDGHPDVVTTGATDGIHVLLHAGRFSPDIRVKTVAKSHPTNGLAVGRLDKDKWPDVVIGTPYSQLWIYRGTGTSSLLAKAAEIQARAAGITAAAIANVDHHGRPDLVGLEPRAGNVEVLLAR
ncbi:MAG TPA: VCBS repeat-containing protein [Nocardioides sp.]|jgi:hypothetical protein|uniref:FG-GAP repeat domain-containing protein n=1 Tax=Nocardioides sp. TaxID=35761 RepID=UPI002E2FBCA5|nr:VCBS repeat-containing protein [Nocardioides sp.]HEX3932687.1 VCBS repeat-containing protein [Nocardioides sp.]